MYVGLIIIMRIGVSMLWTVLEVQRTAFDDPLVGVCDSSPRTHGSMTEYGSEKMAEEERSASAEKLKEKANNYFKGKSLSDI